MRQAEKILCYMLTTCSNTTVIVLAPMAQLDWTQTAISAGKSLLNPFLVTEKQPIATNWGLMCLPDCCTHFKGADQRQGEGTMWMFKRLSESQWWWLPSIAFCGFNSQSIPHASKPKCSNMLTRKKMLSKVTGETYFLYKRTFKKWNSEHTLKMGCAKDSVNN